MVMDRAVLVRFGVRELRKCKMGRSENLKDVKKAGRQLISRCPEVRIWKHRQYKVVDYDTCVLCRELTRDAQNRLYRVMWDYYGRHNMRGYVRWRYDEVTDTWLARLERPAWVGRDAGALVVLPEDAGDVAARMLMFVSDPRNHDPERDYWLRYAKDRYEHRTNRDPFYFHILPEDRVKVFRPEIEDAFPELVDDPLGQIAEAA